MSRSREEVVDVDGGYLVLGLGYALSPLGKLSLYVLYVFRCRGPNEGSPNRQFRTSLLNLRALSVLVLLL
jgi:hypothetical protein